MDLMLNNGPHSGQTISCADNSVTVLVGKNSSGKSQILKNLKFQLSDAVLLVSNYEAVDQIPAIQLDGATLNQKGTEQPQNVASFVASDPVLTKIFNYCFKTLYDIDLVIDKSFFKAGEFRLHEEADGFKSLFNIIYYLLSPHKIILLDEPERFLHPSMRSVFISLLSEVAKNYQKTIVLSSHSNLSARYDLDNVFIFQINKNPNSITDIKSWLSSLSSPIYNSTKDKQAFKNWFKYHTNVLFAKTVCLVEGVSDQIILDAIRTKLSFQFNFQNLVVCHVASSHHESGGKSRLHKFQNLLSQISKTFVIADKDIIISDIHKWIDTVPEDSESYIINLAKESDLCILSLGEIEDYYFLEPAMEYCSSIESAKANKIPAAYEQASILYSKTEEEITSKYFEIIEVLKSYADSTSDQAILKSIAQEFLIDKYVKEIAPSNHLKDEINSTNIKVSFKFTSSVKKFTYPISEFEKLKGVKDDLKGKLS